MKAKITRVVLEANGTTRVFSLTHAERLLRMKRNGGWHLPENSKLEMTKDGLRRCRTTKESLGEQAGGGVEPGATAPNAD